jgi:Triosephosphate isomerase
LPPRYESRSASKQRVHCHLLLTSNPQDVAFNAGFGAFTGETSAALLTDAGVKWTLTGHSERRVGFGGPGESSAVVGKKTAIAIAAGLVKQTALFFTIHLLTTCTIQQIICHRVYRRDALREGEWHHHGCLCRAAICHRIKSYRRRLEESRHRVW